MARKDFLPESEEEITKLISGKTIDCFEHLETVIDNFVVIKFNDGTALHMRYDWIYDWEVKHG